MKVSSGFLIKFVYHRVDFLYFSCFYSLLINAFVVLIKKKEKRKIRARIFSVLITIILSALCLHSQ